ncbi:MAG TPA: LptE family protein [Gemmataceae bacterium]|nr:LptE family protein [Gemmataceae bacterium]
MKATSRLALLACAAAALVLPSCESDRVYSFLGYEMGQKALYDCSIHTVRVPIFQNRTMLRGVEFELTRAVVDAINLKTPYRVVGPNEDADTELTGTIVSFTKGLLNVNQLNEVREQQTVMTIEVSWRNLRTGEVLSDPTRRTPGTSGPALPSLPGAAPIAGQPGIVPPGTISAPAAPGEAAAVATPAPVLGPDGKPIYGPDGKLLPIPPSGKIIITALGDFIPEIGQSLTTAQQQSVNQAAVQIVSMMEKPWGLPSCP